ncbi:MAG: threonine--tRNA ligase [Leptospiraceae bacterium]|nr:threonine--tRNA ligase [Leptospiraceae bacterium]MCK6380985.1 threonine--tRNA ligase [Leptospiraceae bacterium]NUM40262.1 threonine--tRNA ligase [Leptospiraceae bacterium]
MSQLTITLPDGSTKSLEKGTKISEFVKSFSVSLFKSALAAKIDGRSVDLSESIESNCKLEIITYDSKEGKEVFHHSSAHLLGQAVQRLWKDAKLTVGPVIETGPGFFYYDIDFPSTTITPDDLPKIEKEMESIVKENLQVKKTELTKKEAIEKFSELGENYKVEIISGIPSEKVTLYGQGEWTDLCRGPHIPNTGLIKAFKLTAISGAYWKADKNNRMLQRIYGVSFSNKKELEEYFFRIEEAKKRDHRKIGKEMDLFSFQEEAPGFPFWHPKGTVLWNTLADYLRVECAERGYQEIRTPAILNANLWTLSGHSENYRENMYYTEIDEEDYAIKPMNCPGCCLIYKHHLHSYRELPLRYSELGMVHRHELHGVLHGLFRVRAFTQDDAHIYTPIEFVESEVISIIDFTLEVYRKFGFHEIKTFIATRPEKSVGNDSDWETATNTLISSLKKKNIEYAIKEGEGAFYGPKIEFNIKDSIGRYWQCGTIQVDFSMPERLGLDYTASDGKKHVPVMLHRAIYGSLERFVGILIEHYEGKFPLWLSPTQIRILTVSDKQKEYARELNDKLIEIGFRSETDLRNEKIGLKIRESILKKANYVLIIGDKEVEGGLVSVRKRGEEETISYSSYEFLEHLKTELSNN